MEDVMKKILTALVIAAIVSVSASTVMAATEWNFGASLRYATFWDQVDYGKLGGNDLEGGGAKLSSDGALNWSQQSNSRIRMWMKSDHLEGYIEIGYNYDDNKLTTRQYWGKYKFNDKAFIQIGQSDQLFTTADFSRQVWGNNMGLHGIGTAFYPESPKIVLGYGGFAFALVDPETNYDQRLTGATGYTRADIDTFFPQLQASYQYKTDAWRFKLTGAYQYAQINDLEANGLNKKDRDINSWMVSADGNVFFGPLALGLTATVGQNWADALWNTKGCLGNKYTPNKKFSEFGAQLSGNKLEDTTSVMAAFVASYQMTEALYFEAGVGYRYDENDAWKDNSHIWSTYVQASYTVAPGFRIIPEVGYINLGDTMGNKARNEKGVDAGYIWYAGAQWRMDF